MGWEFTDVHIRPNVFYWSPKAYNERTEVKTRREQAQKAYTEAKRAKSNGHHAEAEQLLLHSVTAWPDNPRFSLALGNCVFLDRGRPADAVQWYDEAIRLKDCPAHRAARSRARAALGQLDDALDDMVAAAEGEPENPDYRVGRAMLLERLGRFAAAAEEYGAAVPLLKAAGRPIFEALFNRGYCYKMLNRVDEAIAELEAALLQSTTSMTVRTVLGVMYLSRRRYAKAADIFGVVAQQHYGSASAANNAALASFLSVTCDYDDSSAATRAASLNAQRQRAAAMAQASASKRPDAAGGADASGSAPRSLAKQVTRHREASASSAAGAGGGASASAARTSPLKGRGGARAASVAALLDDVVAADEGDILGQARAGGAAAGGGGADASSGTDSEGEGGGGGGGTGGGGGPKEPLPVVYLPADPRQWAADVVRDNSSLAVTDPDKKMVLEQALARFDAALTIQERAAAERRTRSGGGSGSGAEAPKPGRSEQDPDTTALSVGEGGDVPEGLLLMVQREHRTPGTAVVHDREIEEGEVQYNRGLVLLSLGRLADAAADLDAALAANPHHAHYPYYQAVVAARRGQDDLALQWDNVALQRNPRYFHALYHLGLVLHLRGEHREAIARLDAAGQLRPRDWRIMEARGRVLQNLDRHSEAVPMLQAALAAVAADGDQVPAVAARLHFALAQSAVAAHQPGLLRDSLVAARQHGQDPASVYNLRGCLARKERQFDAALRFLGRAVRRSPGDARFYYDRAQCYCDMGLWAEALDDLTAALSLLPNAPLLLFSRGAAQMAWEAGDPQQAADDLEAAAKACGGVLRGEGPLWESRKFMSSGAGSPDLSPSLWYQLGCAQARAGRTAAAVASFRHACGLLPGQPVFTHELAKACQNAGEFANALEAFNKVIALQPKNARAYVRRALAHKCLKHYDEAAADLMRARQLEPANPLVRLDPRALGNVVAVELCAAGTEDDSFLLTKF